LAEGQKLSLVRALWMKAFLLTYLMQLSRAQMQHLVAHRKA
jgi:hypothetical protein